MKVFLDLDNTILDENTGFNKYIPLIFEKYKEYSNLDFDNFKLKWIESLEFYYRQYLNGKISFREQRVNRLKYSFKNDIIPGQILNDFYDFYNFVYEESWTIFDGWINYLENHLNNYYIITNGTSVQQRKKIEKLNIGKFLKGVFVSEEIGFSKPSLEFFSYVLKESDSSIENSIIVGDSFENDITPSIKLGIKSIWINHKKQIEKVRNSVIVVSSAIDAINQLKKMHLTTAST